MDGISTLRSYGELVGTMVRTEHGMQMVWDYSEQRETFLVGETRATAVDYYVEHLREEPMPSDPAQLERWLDKPTWTFVREGVILTVDCSCSCNGCKKGALHVIKPEMLCGCERQGCSCL